MRAYIEGELSTPQPNFHLTDLWFSNDSAEKTDIPSPGCIGLSSDGFDCETAVSSDGTKFSSRWKTVFLDECREDGREYSTPLFSTEQFMLLCEEKHLVFSNASAFFESDVKMRIISIELVDESNKLIIIPQEEVDFIA